MMPGDIDFASYEAFELAFYSRYQSHLLTLQQQDLLNAEIHRRGLSEQDMAMLVADKLKIDPLFVAENQCPRCKSYKLIDAFHYESEPSNLKFRNMFFPHLTSGENYICSVCGYRVSEQRVEQRELRRQHFVTALVVTLMVVLLLIVLL